LISSLTKQASEVFKTSEVCDPFFFPLATRSMPFPSTGRPLHQQDWVCTVTPDVLTLARLEVMDRACLVHRLHSLHKAELALDCRVRPAHLGIRTRVGNPVVEHVAFFKPSLDLFTQWLDDAGAEVAVPVIRAEIKRVQFAVH